MQTLRPSKRLRKGQRFGKLRVVGFPHCKPEPRGYRWLCTCECGTRSWHSIVHVLRGSAKSCGCGWRDIRRRPRLGARFGRLKVTGRYRRITKRGSSTEWECKCSCGNVTWLRLFRLTSGHTKSCGCLVPELSAKRMGPLGSNWDPTITDAERRLRKCTRAEGDRRWNAIRLRAFRRDGFTCTVCGRGKSGALQGHHLANWKHNPHLRYELDNVVTLCVACHKEFHREHGKVRNTAEQFVEFKENYTHGESS